MGGTRAVRWLCTAGAWLVHAWNGPHLEGALRKGVIAEAEGVKGAGQQHSGRHHGGLLDGGQVVAVAVEEGRAEAGVEVRQQHPAGGGISAQEGHEGRGRDAGVGVASWLNCGLQGRRG